MGRADAGGTVSLRVCTEPGCPTIVEQGVRDGRCDEHRRARDRARGTSAERGYGPKHRAERKRWAPLVASGNVKCWRCGEYIAADEPFDLGHDDADRTRYRGPEHQGCNRATAGRC